MPPLENGDRLSRSEFERRYSAMPEVKKAELIEGVVYRASPLRHQPHGKPHFRLITWLGITVSNPTALKMKIVIFKAASPVFISLADWRIDRRR